jgi:cytosine/adenosine deaminase-related metal-dependent hydrolase
MLVTFDVPFSAEATELAVDAAVESGQRLIVVNVAQVVLGPVSLSMKYEYIGTREVEEALRVPAALAHSLAVDVERLRLCSPRPIEALLELVAERAPGLLVVGPDRERLKRRTYAKLTKRIRERAACLVWLPV